MFIEVVRKIKLMTIAGKEITKKLVYKIAGFTALALIVLGFAGYAYLIQREKAQFAAAEKEIDALYAQIAEKVGKPDQEKKEKSCGYASRVYGKGPRSCSVSKYILFENKDIDQANEIVKTISQTINVKPSRFSMDKFGVSGNRYEFLKEDDRIIDQSLGSDLNLGFSKGCSIEFVHPVASDSYVEMFQNISKENLSIGIVCGGPAMAEYFPVKD